jgi:YggT family protein
MGLLGILSLALLIVQFLLIARAVLDWSVVLAGPAMPGSFRSRVSGGVFAVTEPILAPVRRLIPPLRAGGMSIDLSFMVVFFAVVILRSLIN